MSSSNPNFAPTESSTTDTVLHEQGGVARRPGDETRAHEGEHTYASTRFASSEALEERVYTADSDLRHPLRLVRAMFHDLWGSRELAWRLFVRDLNGQYRQSLLGYAWIILPPLAAMLTWVFLNKNGILEVAETSVPYPVFVMTGLVLWEAFVSSLTAPQTAVGSAMGLLTKINFPREALLLSAAGQVVFGIVVRLLILVGVYAWYSVAPSATVWLAPLGLLALMILGFAFGLLLTPALMLYQDFSRGLAIVTGPWFFLTPVVYPSPTNFPGKLVNWLNPVSPLLTGTRELITDGRVTHLLAFVCVALLSLVLLFFSWMFTRLAMPHLIARMSA